MNLFCKNLAAVVRPLPGGPIATSASYKCLRLVALLYFEMTQLQVFACKVSVIDANVRGLIVQFYTFNFCSFVRKIRPETQLTMSRRRNPAINT